MAAEDSYFLMLVNEDYQALVAKGITVRETKDRMQWAIGILATQVEIRWGESSLKSYSSDINIGYSTLRGYRQVIRFYIDNNFKNDWRVAQLRDSPMLSFTHFVYAMRLGSLTDALDFLDDCIDGAWNTDHAYAVISKRLGKSPQPTLVGEFDTSEAAIRYLKAHPGNYTVRVYERISTRASHA